MVFPCARLPQFSDAATAARLIGFQVWSRFPYYRHLLFIYFSGSETRGPSQDWGRGLRWVGDTWREFLPSQKKRRGAATRFWLVLSWFAQFKGI